MIEFTSSRLPSSYSPNTESIYWEFSCDNYIEKELWNELKDNSMCFSMNSDWIYSFDALIYLVEKKLSVKVDGIFCKYKSKLADRILSLAHSKLYEKLLIEHSKEKSRKEAELKWMNLPPRSSSAKELCKIIKYSPLKVINGFCAMCDSRISEEWCWESDYELRHLADIGVGHLRPQEYQIIIEALNKGKLKYKLIEK